MRDAGHPLMAHATPTVERTEENMDTTTVIRMAAGALFVIILVLLIQRRRTRVK